MDTTSAVASSTVAESPIAAPSVADVQFLVREGEFVYPLNSPGAGWGSIISGTNSARVYALRRLDGNGRCELVGEAEIRTYPTLPSENARLMSLARDVLIQEGCFSGPGRLAELPGPYRVPVVTLPAQLRRVWARASRAARRRATTASTRPTNSQWSIGVMDRTAFALAPAFPWRHVRWIEPPMHGFIADPFLIDEGGWCWLFYERLEFSEGKGTLWIASIDPSSGGLHDEREVLRLKHHLSFPQVFKHGDDWYLTAEHAKSGATTLFKATEFPYRWEKYRDLLDSFPGGDPTLFHHGGKWWLFVTFGVYPCNHSNLHLFMADDLDDEFRPHPMSPVRVGLRGSRMAGAILESNGKLLRPGQDCSTSYGLGVVMYEIMRLDATTYEERELYAWSADEKGEYNQGFHTVSMSRDILAVDGHRLQPV